LGFAQVEQPPSLPKWSDWRRHTKRSLVVGFLPLKLKQVLL